MIASASSRKQRKATFGEYGWIIFFIIGIYFCIWAIHDIFDGVNPQLWSEIVGQPWRANYLASLDPSTASLVEFLTAVSGTLTLGLAILVLSISVTGYKKGEKWSWYAFWILPIILGLITILGQTMIGFAFWFIAPIMLVVSLAGLLSSYGKFFPKK